MSLSYTTGNPSNLTAGATASMTDVQGPFTDIKTWADAKFSAADLTTATLQTLGMNSGGQVGRGKSIIATSESTSSAAYTTLTTPDQVAGIVLPTDGVLRVLYSATWQSSVGGAGRAAIFIGANQAKRVDTASFAAPQVQEISSPGIGAFDAYIHSNGSGLTQANTAIAYSGDVTTGQIIGDTAVLGGWCNIFAAAGTYTISVQFKTTSGSATVKNRKLWAKAEGF